MPNEPLRIGYLTGEYPRATDTFIQREVAALRRLGIEVCTSSIRRTGPDHMVGDEQRNEAAQTFYVLDRAKNPLHLVRAHLAAFGRAPGRYLSTIRLAWKTAPPGMRGRLYQLFYFLEAGVLAAHLRQQGVTHLHNHIAKASCTVAMLMSELSGIPFSFTLHGPDIFFEPYHWRLDEKIARARFVACISEFCRSQAMAFSRRDHWDKLHIVHCGIEPGRYGGAGGRGKDLLFVGRLAAVKGLPVLFEAIERLLPRHPGLRLTLIGDGPDRETLEAEARQRRINGATTFAGYRSQAEVAKTLGETDLFVLPSFAEGLPVVLMEAMAARLPVVATHIAGVPELVQDGVSGRLVAPGDALRLEHALDELLSAPETWAEMGKAGRQAVLDGFALEDEAGWLATLIRSYASGGKRPGKRHQGGGL
jgi:glycosyltransferase involved in cell wall biosynthesis